jgi:hypothetical protein
MATEHFIRTAALVALLASCSETSKNPAEPSANNPNPTSPRLMLQATTLATTTTAPARHNPRSQGIYTVQCFEGATDSPGGGFLGVCQRFSPTLDGAEINTFVQGPNGSYAGVTQTSNFIRGRLLTGVVNLNFSYAGGPHVGGAPRLSIPIDKAPTNGTWDFFAFMDGPGCNDGDEFVGRIEGKSDNTCNVSADGIDYPNWTAFVAAHPGARIATNAVTFIIIDQPAHYVIWRIQIN